MRLVAIGLAIVIGVIVVGVLLIGLWVIVAKREK